MDTGRGKSCNEGEIRANHKTDVPILPLEPWLQSLSVGSTQIKTWPLIATSAARLSSHARLAASRSKAITPGPEAQQKFFTRIRQQCMDPTGLKKWTVRETAADKNATFLVPLAIVNKVLVNIEIEAVLAAARR
jgi:hypothetical protein